MLYSNLDVCLYRSGHFVYIYENNYLRLYYLNGDLVKTHKVVNNAIIHNTYQGTKGCSRQFSLSRTCKLLRWLELQPMF